MDGEIPNNPDSNNFSTFGKQLLAFGAMVSVGASILLLYYLEKNNNSNNFSTAGQEIKPISLSLSCGENNLDTTPVPEFFIETIDVRNYPGYLYLACDHEGKAMPEYTLHKNLVGTFGVLKIDNRDDNPTLRYGVFFPENNNSFYFAILQDMPNKTDSSPRRPPSRYKISHRQ